MTKEEIQKKRDEREKRWQEQCEKMGETCLFSVTVREFHVYVGGFGSLINVSALLKYHVDKPEEFGGEEVIHIKLKEIYEQVKSIIDGISSPMITVFDESPSRTRIYQCGNYSEGCWVKLGEIQGYA